MWPYIQQSVQAFDFICKLFTRLSFLVPLPNLYGVSSLTLKMPNEYNAITISISLLSPRRYPTNTIHMLFSSYSYVMSKLKVMIPLFTSVFYTEVNYFFALLLNTNIQICCKTVNSKSQHSLSRKLQKHSVFDRSLFIKKLNGLPFVAWILFLMLEQPLHVNHYTWEFLVSLWEVPYTRTMLV